MEDSTPSTSKALKLNEMMYQLRRCQWYYGAISSQKAERLLRDRATGHFLLRDSRSDCYLFTISFKTANGPYHTRVQYHNGRFCLGGPNALLWADNLIEFVEKTVQSSKHTDEFDILMHSGDRVEGSANVKFLFPLQRKDFVPSLKYLCRVAVRHTLKDDLFIQQLPVPKRLQKYIASSNYLYPL